MPKTGFSAGRASKAPCSAVFSSCSIIGSSNMVFRSFYFTLFGRRMQFFRDNFPQGPQHPGPVQGRDGQQVERPGQDVGGQKGPVPHRQPGRRPGIPEHGQQRVGPRARRRQPELAPRRQRRAAQPHAKPGHGHFHHRQPAEQQPKGQDVPALMEAGRQQADAQKLAAVEVQQDVQQRAGVKRVPKDQPAHPDPPGKGPPPHAGSPSRAEGSRRTARSSSSKWRWGPVARPVWPAVPSTWPACTTSPGRANRYCKWAYRVSTPSGWHRRR